jgi:hypothetical protein
MVQWGANTVHTFDAASTTASSASSAGGGGFGFGGAPAASSYAAAAPTAGGGLFGSAGFSTGTATTAPPFGAAGAAASGPAPTFGGTGPFGSSAAAAAPLFGGGAASPAPAGFGGGGGGLFGGTGTGTGGLFGSTGAAAAPGTGLFGSPSSSFSTAPGPSPGFGSFGGGGSSGGGGLFGGSTAGGLGAPAPAPPILVPAQAALLALQNAEARQEEARVVAALTSVHQAYSGTAMVPEYGDAYASARSSSAPFALIYYTDASPELRQQQWLQGMVVPPDRTGSEWGTMPNASAIMPIVPPRPPQVSARDWNEAVARNPHPARYMPSALVGAAALQSRISYQQESANALGSHLDLVRETLGALVRQSRLVQDRADKARARRDDQRFRLLDLMRKVEIVRCFRQPLQAGEVQALDRLGTLYRELDRTVRPAVSALQERAKEVSQQKKPTTRRNRPGAAVGSMSSQQIREWEATLRDGHGASLARLQQALDRPVRDLALLQRRVDRSPPAPIPAPPLAALRR